MRGNTLIEILVAIAILGILMGAVLFLYLTGGRAVVQGDLRSELLRQLQVPGTRLSREIDSSSFEGLSAAPTALALLSSVPAGGGAPTLATDGSVLWQKYVVYWHDSAARTLFRREYAITPTVNEQPIESWQGLTLADYTVDGEPVGKDITAFNVSVPTGTRRVLVSLTAEKSFRGTPRQHTLQFTLRLKN